MSTPATSYERHEPGYDEARAAAVWNDLKPDRFPDLIVQAKTGAHVVEAVRLARDRGLKIKVRAGGHSWSASGVRDGGMLLDLSRMKEITYDPDSKGATAQPGAYGRELNDVLEPNDRFFPSGHCPTVGLGGYLLQGGLGWQSRLLGPACASVEAVDVVTAAGEVVRADEHVNSDLYWAARGAGPGFFGVVTRFYLRTHPRAAVIRVLNLVYPLELVDEVLRWAIGIAPHLAPEVEVLLLGTNPRRQDGSPAPGGTAVQIIACAMAASEREALDMLAIFDTCPVVDRVVSRVLFPATMSQLYAAVDALEPAGHRWVADNMWTDADANILVPELHELFHSVPNEISHVLWYPYRDHPIDAAYSNAGHSYVAAYAGWTDPGEDERFTAWPTNQMRRLEPLSKGLQLGDENLVRRRWRYLSAENEARLELLREKWDPEGRFLSYLICS